MISGLAAYLNWDVTLLRLIMFVVLICGYGVLIPIYIICWLIIPRPVRLTEKLSMRGEDITIENIGKTVTDGFERVANGVNNYVNSGKPRSFLQKVGDALVSIAGFFLKACLVVLAIICSPVLLCLPLFCCSGDCCHCSSHWWWSCSLSYAASSRLVTADLHFADDDHCRKYCRSSIGGHTFGGDHLCYSPTDI